MRVGVLLAVASNQHRATAAGAGATDDCDATGSETRAPAGAPNAQRDQGLPQTNWWNLSRTKARTRPRTSLKQQQQQQLIILNCSVLLLLFLQLISLIAASSDAILIDGGSSSSRSQRDDQTTQLVRSDISSGGSNGTSSSLPKSPIEATTNNNNNFLNQDDPQLVNSIKQNKQGPRSKIVLEGQVIERRTSSQVMLELNSGAGVDDDDYNNNNNNNYEQATVATFASDAEDRQATSQRRLGKRQFEDQYEHPAREATAKEYTNQFVIQVEGGEGAARKIAQKHGFVYLNHILGNYYHLEQGRLSRRSIAQEEGKEEEGRSHLVSSTTTHSSNLTTTTSLIEDEPQVLAIERQVLKRRVKRDFLDLPQDEVVVEAKWRPNGDKAAEQLTSEAAIDRRSFASLSSQQPALMIRSQRQRQPAPVTSQLTGSLSSTSAQATSRDGSRIPPLASASFNPFNILANQQQQFNWHPPSRRQQQSSFQQQQQVIQQQQQQQQRNRAKPTNRWSSNYSRSDNQRADNNNESANAMLVAGAYMRHRPQHANHHHNHDFLLTSETASSPSHHLAAPTDSIKQANSSHSINGNRTVSTQAPFNDPGWPLMWYLDGGAKNGFDLNVVAAWKMGYTGKGIVITILDDGLEKDHPDLQANYDPLASFDINGDDADPMPRYDATDSNRHGTRCAGEVAAVPDNNICSIGIAYNSKVGGVRMLDGEVTDAVEARSLGLNNQHIHIYSASWGPDDNGRTVDGPGELATKAFIDGVTFGRQGLGSIFVFASGNGGREHDNCNCDGYTNSIWTLSISSATENGLIPWYIESCSSTLATTYSSGSLDEKQIATTDIHHSCTSAHTGTSASAPLAAGICALVLESNPRLTWRDMQHLVVRTAKPANLMARDWRINALGRNVSHAFGYGLMDAAAMIQLARQWTTVPTQYNCVINLPAMDKFIPPKGSVELRLNATCPSIRFLEHVQSKISLTASRRGDLHIYLVSPLGTRSTLLAQRPHDQAEQGFKQWPFMTVHSWGESPNGIWTLEVHNDGKPQNRAHLKEWTMIMYGTQEDPNGHLDARRQNNQAATPGGANTNHHMPINHVTSTANTQQQQQHVVNSLPPPPLNHNRPVEQQPVANWHQRPTGNQQPASTYQQHVPPPTTSPAAKTPTSMTTPSTIQTTTTINQDPNSKEDYDVVRPAHNNNNNNPTTPSVVATPVTTISSNEISTDNQQPTTSKPGLGWTNFDNDRTSPTSGSNQKHEPTINSFMKPPVGSSDTKPTANRLPAPIQTNTQSGTGLPLEEIDTNQIDQQKPSQISKDYRSTNNRTSGLEDIPTTTNGLDVNANNQDGSTTMSTPYEWLQQSQSRNSINNNRNNNQSHMKQQQSGKTNSPFSFSSASPLGAKTLENQAVHWIIMLLSTSMITYYNHYYYLTT